MGSTPPTPTFGAILEPWCAIGATGALRLAGPVQGAIFLEGGLLAYAESPHAIGVDRLLTSSGRLPPEVWRAAVAAGRSGRRVGEVLLDQGVLSRAELELITRSALFDAALYLFDVCGEAHFEPGARPLIGVGCLVEFHDAGQELDRRRRRLAEIWPDDMIDTAAVVPARRLGGHHVALNAVQWEIVANADRRRTCADLARLLGRETYVVRLEARRLARAGLVVAPVASAVSASAVSAPATGPASVNAVAPGASVPSQANAGDAAAVIPERRKQPRPRRPVSDADPSSDLSDLSEPSVDPADVHRQPAPGRRRAVDTTTTASHEALPVVDGTRAERRRPPAPDASTGNVKVPAQRGGSGSALAAPPAPAMVLSTVDGPADSSWVLPQRGLDEALPWRLTPVEDVGFDTVFEAECSEQTLIRIRRGLEALR